MTTATTKSATPPVRRKKRADGWTALIFLSPLLVIYAVYFLYSIIFLGQTSVQKVGILGFLSFAKSEDQDPDRDGLLFRQT